MKPSGSSPPTRYRSTGQTAVEFALASFVLFMVMFGIIKFGMAVYTYNTVSHTARECVRYAVVHGPGSVNSQSAATIQQRFKYAYISGGAPLTVTVTFPQDPNFATLQDAQCSISYNYYLQVPFLPSKTLTLTNTERMILSQ